MKIIHYKTPDGAWKQVRAYKKGWYYYEAGTDKRIDNIFIYWIENEK